MKTKDQIVEMLETVVDPDINVDIWTMGLIYDINILDENNIEIIMTLTSPLCPSGEYLQKSVSDSMRGLGFENVEVKITFDPPWKPPQSLKDALGI